MRDLLYSAKARESMLQNLLDEGKREPVYNPGPSNRSNFPMAGSSAFFESSTPQAQIPPPAYIPQKVLIFHHIYLEEFGQLIQVYSLRTLQIHCSNFQWPINPYSTSLIETLILGRICLRYMYYSKNFIV